MEENDEISEVMKHLLSYREKKPGAIKKIDPKLIVTICAKVSEIFLQEKSLIRIHAGISICGDIHGQFFDLLRIFEINGIPSPTSRYLFLGDYVDRGSYSLETIILLFCFKIKYKNDFFLLRGNHEDASLNRAYGFFDECKRKYNVSIWKNFVNAFNTLPVAALVSGRILCMHGGLSPSMHSYNQIDSIRRPCEIPDTGILCDLLWSDPDSETIDWASNDRGVSYTFGTNQVSKFLLQCDLDLICRAHQVVEDGYEFFAKRGLVTVFSAPNYSGAFTNSGAILCVDKNLTCSFKIFNSKN